MFKNLFKSAWRHFRKEKVSSIIHVISITLGMTCAFLILLYIQDEMSYDRFNIKHDRIYRLTSWFSPDGGKSSNHFARCSNAWRPWMDALHDEHPEIENIARLTRRHGTIVRIGEDRFRESCFFITDQHVFDVFTIPLIEGNPQTALQTPYTVILTASMANKYFQGQAVGKSITLLDLQGETRDYQVTGVMEDWPANSHIQIHFLASNAEQDQSRDWAYTYLLLKENSDGNALERKFPEFIRRRFGEQADTQSVYYLQKLSDIHLESHLDRELKVNGNRETIVILWIVAAFVILIACINYVNLTTAQAVKRSKEMGIRSAIGSSRVQLAARFLIESLCISGIASMVSILLLFLILPEFNGLTGKSLHFMYLFQGVNGLLFVGMMFGFGILAGMVPAIAFSRKAPAAALRSASGLSLSHSIKGLPLRNILVTLQFSISAILLICTLILTQQLRFIHRKPLGMNKEQVICVGKQINWNNSVLNLQSGPVIGVVKDFHFSTLHKEVKPFLMVYEPRFFGSVLIRIKPENMSATLGEIGAIWNEMFPNSPFEYHFLDDLFAGLYQAEQQLIHVIIRFTGIAIIIACLGLFGLILYATEQRTKEIGVRKVIGASVASILLLLTKDFTRWIIIANLIAWPVAWYAMDQWLQNFAYHINITIWPFLLAGLSALVIALLTVSRQAMRAATANPVESLRYE